MVADPQRDKDFTLKQWEEEGERRFGPNRMRWRFVCPACQHVASTEDYKAAGAPSTAVAFSCIGRWTVDLPRDAFGSGPGPCNYAGGGLIGLNPVRVAFPDGKVLHVFDFGEAPK